MHYNGMEVSSMVYFSSFLTLWVFLSPQKLGNYAEQLPMMAFSALFRFNSLNCSFRCLYKVRTNSKLLVWSKIFQLEYHNWYFRSSLLAPKVFEDNLTLHLR